MKGSINEILFESKMAQLNKKRPGCGWGSEEEEKLENVLENCVLHVSVAIQERSRLDDIFRVVHLLGGSLQKTINSKVTHIVMDACGSEFPYLDGAANFTFVTEFWLQRILRKRRLSPPKSLMYYQPALLLTSKNIDMSALYPINFQETWDENHVKFPFSRKNLHGDYVPKWPYIYCLLSRRPMSMEGLEFIIRKLITGHNRISFCCLKAALFERLSNAQRDHFFLTVLPRMCTFAMRLPHLFYSPVKLLSRNRSEKVVLNQEQIACLLVHAFFGSFPDQGAFFPTFNITNLFYKSRHEKNSCRVEKIITILHYFCRILPRFCDSSESTCKNTNVAFFRVCADTSDLCMLNDKLLSEVVFDNDNVIEDSTGDLQVDFANKYIGGGVLGNGCVQEEIRFLINPELLVSCLLTEKLEDNECLLMIGSERFASYSGYGSKYKFAGNFIDKTEIGPTNIRDTWILGIDAKPYSRYPQAQFLEDEIEREFTKLYVGYGETKDLEDNQMQGCHPRAIATGSWGCGAFNGDFFLKFLLQWLACSCGGRKMIYYTFHDPKLGDQLNEFVRKMTDICCIERRIPVLSIYQCLLRLSEAKLLGKENVFDQMYSSIRSQFAVQSPSPQDSTSMTTNDHASKKRVISSPYFDAASNSNAIKSDIVDSITKKSNGQKPKKQTVKQLKIFEFFDKNE